MTIDIYRQIDSYRDEMIDTLKKMIAIPAISPESGGEGEEKRADFLESVLKGMGLSVRRYDYKDKAGAKRPNLIATYGNAERTIWILSHMDTVSAGDIKLWSHDPFDAYVKDRKVFGRGTSDNGQGVISSIYALKAIIRSKMPIKYRFGIALVADEEVGSEYGAKKLVREKIFNHNDMVIVPDWGTSRGDAIEIAEKGILWVKLIVEGKQVHASTPNKGVNAYRVAISMLKEMDEKLHKKYSAKDKLFDPSFSTFEMTKHEKNVDSVNIVPGSDISYMDCRILPRYKIDAVIKDLESIASKYSNGRARASIYIYNREDPAKPTSADSEIAKRLASAIKSVKGINPKFVGIGGGTVAKYFRDLGMQAVVWATLPDNAHQPDEYLIIDDMVSDAKVFAHLFVG
ncbi:MAG: M20 family metallo-hydrolase [Candidatus Micrarchaeia archaeon]